MGGCVDRSVCSKRHRKECENELFGYDGSKIWGCDNQSCSLKHRSVNEQEKLVTIPESELNDLKSNILRLEAIVIDQKEEMDLNRKNHINEIFEFQDVIRNLNIELSASCSEKRNLQRNCKDLKIRLAQVEEENHLKSQDEKLLAENESRDFLQDQKNSVLPSPTSTCSLLSN